MEFVMFTKEFDIKKLEEIEGRIDWYKGISMKDNKIYILNYI